MPRRFLQQGDDTGYAMRSDVDIPDLSEPKTAAEVSTVPTTTTPMATTTQCRMIYTLVFSVRAKGKLVHRVDNIMEDSLLPGAAYGLRAGNVEELFWQFNIDFGNKVMSDSKCDWITSRTYRMYKYLVTTDDVQVFEQLKDYLAYGALAHDLEGQKGICGADVKIIHAGGACDRP